MKRVWIVYEHGGYNALSGENDPAQPPVAAFISEQAAKDWIHDNIPHSKQLDMVVVALEVRS